jgi:hypothetical protein
MSSDLDELRARLSGGVLGPSGGEYERARLCFNLLIDRPGRDRALPQLRGRRHRLGLRTVERARDRRARRRPQPPGHCAVDDGLVVDLSRMRNVDVDPDARETS